MCLRYGDDEFYVVSQVWCLWVYVVCLRYGDDGFMLCVSGMVLMGFMLCVSYMVIMGSFCVSQVW